MEDRISFLPTDVRDNILSRLPTQEAIRTTLLSTRWRNVCSTLLNLTFDQPFDSPALDEASFIRYISQTLSHHDPNSSIDTFCLRLKMLHPDAFSHRLTQWVSFALAHNAHAVMISSPGHKLPLSLFAPTTSLTHLYLHNITLTLSAQLKLPNLTDLSLNRVEFVDHNAMTRLIGSSMALVGLLISKCSWKYCFTLLNIPSPKLIYLVLQGYHPFTKIQHCSNNLRQLNYLGYAPDFNTNHFSSITYASFIIPPNITGPRVSSILKGLESVINLFLGGFFVELLVKEGDQLLSQLPISCSSLKHLSLNLYPTRNQVRVTKFILTQYPNLETLYINVKGSGQDLKSLNTGELWKNEKLQTNYSFRQLKIVEIEGCGESEIEMDLIRFLLENGPAMKKMDIFLKLKNKYDPRKCSSVSEKIHKFSRESSCVEVSVSTRTPVFSMYKSIGSSMFRKWEALSYWNDAS